MKKRIPKNKRRAFPYFDFFIPVLIKRDKSFSIIKHIKFSESTMYFFEDEDQHDVNKLFGFSFGMHHNNSVRFGWRPNENLSRMEIVGYEYLNKLRIPTIPICEVQLNKWYKYELKYKGGIFGQIEYIVSNEDETHSTVHPIALKNESNWGYKLYLYFGGNKKAPHDMIIHIK
jgi:hypothetical protein